MSHIWIWSNGHRPTAVVAFSFLFACLLSVVAPLSAQDQTAAVPDVATPAKVRAADRVLENIRSFSHVPGASAAVMIDGELVWTGVSGWADLEEEIPVTPESRFRLASVTKLYTAALALRLWEEGLLDLDADVRRYVPSWPDHNGAVITPRLLAAHTAGINHYQSRPRDDSAPGRHYDEIVDALAAFADAPLLQPPGEEYSYSSYGYALLNAAMTSASGRTYTEALDSFVLQPLALSETSVEDVRLLPPNAVTLYRVNRESGATAIRPNDQSFVWGASGMRATARDLARFGSVFLSGTLVSEETRDMALTPARLLDGRTAGIGRYEVGFGWRSGLDWDGRPVAHHAGLTPGARTVLLGYPGGHAAVALLLNATWTSRIETTAELLAAPLMESGGADDTDCPTGAWQFDGEFDGNAERGEIRLAPDDGLCLGTFRSEGALIALWLDNQPNVQRDFPLVRVARRGNAHIFAMANPWGLAQVRITVEENELRGQGDVAGRPFSIEGRPVR